jgi:hypothetical protein
MARKRVTPAITEPTARGRPRRNARSTYASAPENRDVEEPLPEDQPMVAEEQPAPNPTPEQVLHQLQAELKR